MDDFKPEDEMKPDPSDRRGGRSRQSSGRDSDPQINFDDVDLDEDRRPARGSKASEAPEEEYYESDDEPVERRPRKRKKAPAPKPASRQYLMMGLGILVLLLLIIGIGSALKAPSSPSGDSQAAGGGRNIDLSGSGDAASNQANGAQPAPGNAPANNPSQDAGAQTAGNQPQDVSLPPISSTPAQDQSSAAPQGQQRMEVQGDLNNALTQQPGQMDSAVANSTLPTEPATVAPIHGSSAQRQPARGTENTAAAAAPRAERKHSVIEPKPQSKPHAAARTEPQQRSEPAKRAEPPKRSEPAAVAHAPVKTETAKPVEAAKPAETAKPAATSSAKTSAPAATSAPTAATASSGATKGTGDVSALKSAPSGHYTLQLSSSSNYDNLNNWAKKENVKNYVVYQTTRNGQPWYVLVSGVYATKDDAKRAVSTLPADVQAKNPWAKPVRQVQSDLK